MTTIELNTLGIRQWGDISKNYANPDILLGNGFSISQNSKFTYRSLFQIFLSNCPAGLRPTFELFGTVNFELILEYLTYSVEINKSLGIDYKPIENAIEVLKKGLIETIREVHPKVGDIDWGKIKDITIRLAEFGNVYTTNYDLYLYHIIMQATDMHGKDPAFRPYNDYFWGSHHAPAGFKEFVPRQDYTKYKHIYYLHGALFVFADGSYDLKITRGAGAELIDIIEDEINAGRFPIFVAEGNAEDKVNSIYRSPYLRFSLGKLAFAQTPILIYGNSLSKVDMHIVDAIKANPRPIIFSIYPGTKTAEEINKEKADILVLFPASYGQSVEFVDSNSLF
jgi:hypothetical protein